MLRKPEDMKEWQREANKPVEVVKPEKEVAEPTAEPVEPVAEAEAAEKPEVKRAPKRRKKA